MKLSVTFEDCTHKREENLELSSVRVVLPGTDSFKDIACDLLLGIAVNTQGDSSGIEDYFYSNVNRISHVTLQIDGRNYTCTPEDLSGLAGMPKIGITIYDTNGVHSYDCSDARFHVTIYKHKSEISFCCEDSIAASKTNLFI